MKKFSFILLAYLCLFSTAALAFGPFSIYHEKKSDGTIKHKAFVWEKGDVPWKYDARKYFVYNNKVKIPVEALDNNYCKTVKTSFCDTYEVLKYCGIVKCIDEKFKQWQNLELETNPDLNSDDKKFVSTVTITPHMIDKTSEAISADNYLTWVNNAQKYHYAVIVLDTDGSIIQKYITDADPDGTGDPKALLGLTIPFQPIDPQNNYYTGGFVILNGLAIDGIDNNPIEVDIKSFGGTVLHELGHLLGLDHTQPLVDVLGSEVGDAPKIKEGVPTMYPKLITDYQTTLHIDDKIGLSAIYAGNDNAPEAFTEDFCTIEGYIINSNDGKAYQGVNVIAYADASSPDNFIDARSFVSGVMMPPLEVRDGAIPDELGHYILPGIIPGRPYKVAFEAVLDPFKNQQGGLNPYPGIPGPDMNDIAKSGSNLITAGGGYTTVSCGTPSNPTAKSGDATYQFARDGTMKMESTNVEAPSDSIAVDDTTKKKGWCMSVGGDFEANWGILLIATVACLAIIRKSKVKNLG